MRFYGHREGSIEETPMTLGEVTIVASPLALRRLATFFNHMATLMETNGGPFGHEHLSDFDETMDDEPTLVVMREPEKEASKRS